MRHAQTKHKALVYKKYQAPLFAGPGFSPLCGYKMSSFTAFFSDLDASLVFDSLMQTARAAQAVYNRATALLQSTDPSVAAGTALVPFVQDVQPVINMRTTQAAHAVEKATKACQQHVTHMTASRTQYDSANALVAEKVRLENVQYTFTMQEENNRHERMLTTLHNQNEAAAAARTAVVTEEDAEAVRRKNVLDSAQDDLFRELNMNASFLTTSGLVMRIENSPAGGAAGGAAVGVDVPNALGAGCAAATPVTGAGDDSDLEEGEVRPLKRGRDDSADDAAACTASTKAKFC